MWQLCYDCPACHYLCSCSDKRSLILSFRNCLNKNLIIVDAPFSENIPQIESFPLYLNKIIDNPIQYFFSSGVINITNNNKIYFTVSHISYTFSTKYNLIEFKYYITFYDHNWDYIMPSILNLLYNLHILCEINISDNNEKIYSMAHIHENICYICIEYARTTEHAKFGIRIYKSDENDEEIEYNDFFFLMINKLLILIQVKVFKMTINLI